MARSAGRRSPFYLTHGPVLNLLREGDHVTGTIWRGRLTEIATNDAAQVTDDAPADMRARALIGALIMVPCGLPMTAACGWRLSRRGAPTPGMVATLGLAFGLFFAGLFSPSPRSCSAAGARTPCWWPPSGSPWPPS